MSKRAKTRSRLDRLKHRRSVKQANRDRYERQMAAGNNSRRSVRMRKKQQTAKKQIHEQCGNIGCLRCSDVALKGKYLQYRALHGEAAAFQAVQKLLLGRATFL